MVKRKRIGIGLFFNNTSNSGIVNYIYNIVAALNTLPDDKRPVIILIHNETAEIRLIKEIGYSYIHFVLLREYPQNYFVRKINSLLRRVTGIDTYKKFFVYKGIQCFYPYFPFLNLPLKDAPNKIEWLVDFNNMAFPQHYEDGGKWMQQYQEELVKKEGKIVLSSYALLNELKQYYPSYKSDVKILRFACSLPPLDDIDFTAVKDKFKIEEIYFMSPNQFWEHKNQMVVLKAVRNIKATHPHIKFKVLFTGSIAVNRGKGLYAEQLKNAIEDYGIDDYVQFLGVLDRKEQLVLMKTSLALIQPSLYEGWSTLVEEAKALNKLILLSTLPVHKEQIGENCIFFEPCNDILLGEIMLECLSNKHQVVEHDYKNNIQQYGREILNVLVGD